MKAALALLATLLAAAGASLTSPVTKAVELLSELQGNILKEGEAAQKTYEEYSEWCEERARDLSHEIKTGKAEVAELQAAAAEATSAEDSLGARLEKLASGIATDQADIKAAAEIRGKEHAAFLASEKELVEVIDTLHRAIGILKREAAKSGSSLAQLQGASNLAEALDAMVEASMLSTADAGKLTALAQTSQVPAGAIYENHGKDIVEVLDNLLDEAEAQLDEERQAETRNQHAFELMEQGLKDEIKFAEKETAEAKQGRAAAGERKAKATGELAVTSKDLGADEAALGDLHHECMTRAENFEAETKSRSEELKALAEAKRALQENVGAAAEESYSFAQVGTRITSHAGLVQVEAVRLVRDLARKEKSPELAQLAARMGSAVALAARSGEDQFDKVKGLIRDMIQRLEKAAEEDSTKKAFCDKSLAETNQKKTEKTTEIEKLTTAIDQMSARSTRLKEQVAGLQKALSELIASQAEMDKIRSEEKAEFATSKADMEQGLKGVKLALKVLNEYYSRQDKAHSAAEGAGTTVIGLLEVVESDFTKDLAEMSAFEEAEQAAYDAQTRENEIDRATKEQDVKYKTKEAAELDQSIAESSADRGGVQSELDAVSEYLSKLEAQCVEKADTYEERHARFEAELAGLRDALRILESETVLLQGRSHAHRLRGGALQADHP